jgi:hypothetical protein
MDSPHFLILHACVWATCQHRLDFVHHKGHSVAAPQPNFGISPAKALRPQSSEIKGGNVLPSFFTFPHNLSAFAPWREKYPIPIVFRSQIICASRENFEA